MSNTALSTALTRLSQILEATCKGNSLLEKTRCKVSADLKELFPALMDALPLLHAEKQQIPADISALLLALPVEQLDALKSAKSADKRNRLSNLLKFSADAITLRMDKHPQDVSRICASLINPFEHGLKITVATPEKPAKSDAEKLEALLCGLKKVHNLEQELPEWVDLDEFRNHVAYFLHIGNRMQEDRKKHA